MDVNVDSQAHGEDFRFSVRTFVEFENGVDTRQLDLATDSDNIDWYVYNHFLYDT
jgi:hypothetical protein